MHMHMHQMYNKRQPNIHPALRRLWLHASFVAFNAFQVLLNACQMWLHRCSCDKPLLPQSRCFGSLQVKGVEPKGAAPGHTHPLSLDLPRGRRAAWRVTHS